MDLIPTGTRYQLTGTLMSHFDTFKRPIVVYKEPIQTVNNVTDSQFPGYGQPVNSTITYTPVTGVYDAVKSTPRNKAQTIIIPTTNVAAYNAQIRIKVKPDAKDFIMQGKTESIIFDGIKYNVISAPIPTNYLGLQFYLFDLNSTD